MASSKREPAVDRRSGYRKAVDDNPDATLFYVHATHTENPPMFWAMDHYSEDVIGLVEFGHKYACHRGRLAADLVEAKLHEEGHATEGDTQVLALDGAFKLVRRTWDPANFAPLPSDD